MGAPVKPRENCEIRDTVESLELRAAAEGSNSPGTIVGYAALFNRLSLDLGYFREKIAPGAFRSALERSDVRALVNHDPSAIIGRTSARTLRLIEDDFGLRMECDLPAITLGRDTAESIRRGDIQGQSFAFTTGADQWDWTGEVPIRTILEVDTLYDVGPVTYPAYEETSVALRSFRAAEGERTASATAAARTAAAAQLAIARETERDTARLRMAAAF